MIRRPPRSPLFPYTTLSRPQGAKVRRAFPADPAAPSALGWIQAGARTLGILARPQEPAARPPLLPAGSWNLAAPAPGALIPWIAGAAPAESRQPSKRWASHSISGTVSRASAVDTAMLADTSSCITP